jgi:hypothetical protein
VFALSLREFSSGKFSQLIVGKGKIYCMLLHDWKSFSVGNLEENFVYWWGTVKIRWDGVFTWEFSQIIFKAYLLASFWSILNNFKALLEQKYSMVSTIVPQSVNSPSNSKNFPRQIKRPEETH